jgi:hypothetical protein
VSNVWVSRTYYESKYRARTSQFTKKGKADEGRKESHRERKKERSTENPQSLITNTGMGNKRGVDSEIA